MQRSVTLSLTLVLLLSALVLPGAANRPRDPWVLRCVLDGNPRMVVLALHEGIWVSYDATECSLDKLWLGDVDFSGSVWNHVHGPQPESSGETLVRGPIDGPFFVSRKGQDMPCEAVWRGYRLDGDQVTLQYEIKAGAGTLVLTEIPEVYMEDGDLRFERRFFLSEAPEGYMLGMRLRAEHDREPLDLRHDGEVAEDMVGMQFYSITLPLQQEIVIDAIFEGKGVSE